MYKLFLTISFIVLIATPTFSVENKNTTEEVKHSIPAGYYVPQTQPQSMYGLSGQQFIPQINITGGSQGIQIDNPYIIDKSEMNKSVLNNKQKKQINSNTSIINTYEDKKLPPIHTDK